MLKACFLSSALACAATLCVTASSSAQTAAQDGFIARYQARVTATQSQQPHFPTPLVTSSPGLVQAMRVDFLRQINTRRFETWNLDASKGLELIPARRVELLLNLPPYFVHAEPGVKDGFGDMSFSGKYRIHSRNEESGGRAVTAVLSATIPTGKNSNGSCCAVVTPGIAMAKVYKLLDFTTTFSGSLPVSNAAKLGHTMTWNNVVQYHVATHGMARRLWPEVEFNSSFFSGGANDGKSMTFATPGIIFATFPLRHDANGRPGRLGLQIGAGEQIALTHFHTFNHGIVITTRLPF